MVVMFQQAESCRTVRRSIASDVEPDTSSDDDPIPDSPVKPVQLKLSSPNENPMRSSKKAVCQLTYVHSETNALGLTETGDRSHSPCVSPVKYVELSEDNVPPSKSDIDSIADDESDAGQQFSQIRRRPRKRKQHKESSTELPNKKHKLQKEIEGYRRAKSHRLAASDTDEPDSHDSSSNDSPVYRSPRMLTKLRYLAPNNNHTTAAASGESRHSSPGRRHRHKTKHSKDAKRELQKKKPKMLKVLPKLKPKAGCKRSYDQIHYCLFCAKPVVSKITRHLLKAHASEVRVQEIVALPKKSQKRLYLSELLRNEGNYQHNISALSQGTGHIVVGRRCDKVPQRAYGYTACSF